MRHGVLLLPEHRWPRARERWILAEELGYDHAWTYDHLMWRWLSDKPWFSAVPTLAAAAGATSRITLGTMVASPNFRHPVDFAKELVSLDDISGGRMVCGVGAGAEGHDARIRGDRPLSRRERGSRFEEFVDLLDRLLREKRTTLHGQWYTVEDVVVQPECLAAPRLPLAVAAAGPRGMALAARYADVWVTSGAPNSFESERYDRVVPLLKEQLAALDDACAALGRDPSTLRRLLLTGGSVGGVLESVESYRDSAGVFRDIGFTDFVVHWPRPEPPFRGREEVLFDFATTELGGAR
ncbi:LLM class flavin-dependent oxidoreductase [Streptomyces calidiresistens]|uniref:LLM class flavin-dependent oxidoreductase n=1 Tax=Streptomyces calidiresistens TaxID=1485586 RepID=A0A7W3SZC8_9ACTN|nr:MULTISPECIES: LLM class flavin-dependent oxidoreductase [Streptomyces]MBB0228078.1 LLM class flavin-dependent oxidoreductase [Streptomyces calidiresistens]MQS05741.1 LLM class flavin-dependent oxidoreductase [Streptomyces alkaliphilus]